MQGIFYHPGKNFVPQLPNKDLKDFIDDIAQLVALDGGAAEEALRNSGSLFSFLDQVVPCIVRIRSVLSKSITAGKSILSLWMMTGLVMNLSEW